MTIASTHTCQTSQSVGTTAWSTWPLATTLRNVCDALQEGFAAHRQYEHLRSRGTSHDAALKQAFGISQHGRQHEPKTTFPSVRFN
jgi:hypothetical protein